VKQGVFLVHGEYPAIAGLNTRLATMGPSLKIIEPELDTAHHLTPGGALATYTRQELPRIKPARVGCRDWHNEFKSLILDLQDQLEKAADEKRRGVILRKIRRTFDEAGPQSASD